MAKINEHVEKVNSKITHLNAKLYVKELQLNALLDITNSINSNFSTTSLLEKYKIFLKDELKIEKLALYSLHIKWSCILSYGFSDEDLANIEVERDLIAMKEITSVNTEQKNVLAHFDIVIPVYQDKTPLAYLLLADKNNEELSVSRLIKHLNFLQLLTNITVSAIEKQRLSIEVLRQEKEKRQLIEKQNENLERTVKDRTMELQLEKDQSDRLLYNILPEELVEEIKHDGAITPMRYEEATVIFTDFKDFTKKAEHIPPKKLVNELNELFEAFDFITDRFHIEKIKTIGDSYMAVSGLPKTNPFHAIMAVKAAMEMVKFISERKKKNGINWEMRVGIHSGPLVAGVVGTKKFIYDVWGDTVNIASRMESSGISNEINISESTHKLIKDYFETDYRGKKEAKGKGKLKMYIVTKEKEPARFSKLKKFITRKLSKELNENLYYHNLKHTLDVCEAASNLALREYIDNHSAELLKVAALFHDTGFLKKYNKNESAGKKLAMEYLPKFKYHKDEIKTVCEIIMATELPHHPSNKLEEIIADADLDYLGRSDFPPIAKSLFEELNENGHPISNEEWLLKQIDFLKSHKYFTKTAQELRNKGKQKRLDKLLADQIILEQNKIQKNNKTTN